MITGKASPAKAVVGDKAVFAYIASLPQPQRDIAESVDALAAKTLPGLQRSVKWGMSYYGVGDGWCFSCGGFAGHVKLMFVNGAALEPVPPVTPVAMGRSTRGVELESMDDLDKRQVAAWMKQVAARRTRGLRSLGLGDRVREYRRRELRAALCVTRIAARDGASCQGDTERRRLTSTSVLEIGPSPIRDRADG